MHHVVLERWSRGRSVLHRRDARAKTLALLVFLVVLATSYGPLAALSGVYFALLLSALLLARLPVAGALARSALVLPFSVAFAAVSLLAGDAPRAAALLSKSYLSALAVLILISTTPLPQLLRGLEQIGVPHFLLMVAQFLYRYLFVISEEAQHMRVAALSRGASVRGMAARRARFRAAAGALAVLFARSYARAGGIHRAMLSRGFQGRFHLLAAPRFGWADAAFLLLAALLPAAARGFLGGWRP
ncbi:MAG TPA: energy-coupling factor transporter transmembrane component T [Bryobacteraceae bacterium]|nr:energy-coupling factor transporter transmembrane component T [Bryobacteraceae bacterium]